MKVTKHIAVIILFLLLYTTLRAQTPTLTSLNLPNTIPPSPAAQNFLRYGEIPVDYSTGVPNVSVPLYTAKSRQLSVPISISYHASGIKVDDKASVIGLGWVLNAGGMVTMTNFGNGADLPYKTAAQFNSAIDQATAAGYDALNQLGYDFHSYQNNNSWKSTRYTFQLPGGESGVFRYDFQTGNLMQLPYSTVKISKVYSTYSGVPNVLTGFIITDEKGIDYTFKFPAYSAEATNSTFDLVSMVSADKTDTIRFVYKTNENVYTTPSYSSALQLYNAPQNSGGPEAISFTPTVSFFNIISGNTSTGERILDSIITSSAVVKVNAVNDRLDMNYADGKYRVNNISVYSRSSRELIKSYTFIQSYFGNASPDNNLRLRLDGLNVGGNDMVQVEKYAFFYQSTVLPTYPENRGVDNNAFADDYWGYYSGGYGMYRFSDIPYQFTPSSVIGPTDSRAVPSLYSSNRAPDTVFAKACMLTEIDYPTGGKTYFAFEPNYSNAAYNYDGGTPVAGVVGGFRIKRISNYTAAGVAADFKAYTYSPGITRTITSDLYNHFQRTFVGVLTYGGVTFLIPYPTNVISSTPALPLTCDNGPPVFYSAVTEFNGDASGNTGKTVYTYQQPPAMPVYPDPFNTAYYNDPFELDMGFYVPHLLSKTEYKNAGGGLYFPVKSVKKTYTAFLDGTTYHMGLHLDATSYPTNDQNIDNVQLVGSYANDYLTSDRSPSYAGLLGHACYYYLVNDIFATQRQDLLTQSAEYDYNPSDSTKYLANITNYTYGSLANYTLGSQAHMQPTQKQVSSSTGDTYITNYKYPEDFSTTAPYNTMLTENILTPVIQQLDYKNTNSNFLNSVTTNYNQWTGNIIAPQTVQTQKGANAPETRITYDSYDSKANVTGVSKANGPKITYIWSYKGAYPVAEIKNADYATVQAVLGSGNITAMQDASPDEVTLNTFLAPLRTDSRLANAQVSTYAYRPLVGMTSMTDTKGMTTYYEYDSFQRLLNVKDKDHNIIKAYCYNYAGQQVSCFVDPVAPSGLIYARLEGTNYTVQPTTYNSEGGVDNYTTEDLAIHFYSDANCTMPYTLTAATAVQVQINESAYNDMAGNTSYTTTINSYTVSAGVSSYPLGNYALSHEHSYYDSYNNWWDDNYQWDYQIVQPSGNPYTAYPTNY